MVYTEPSVMGISVQSHVPLIHQRWNVSILKQPLQHSCNQQAANTTYTPVYTTWVIGFRSNNSTKFNPTNHWSSEDFCCVKNSGNRKKVAVNMCHACFCQPAGITESGLVSLVSISWGCLTKPPFINILVSWNQVMLNKFHPIGSNLITPPQILRFNAL